MDRGKFPYLTDAQFESVWKMVASLEEMPSEAWRLLRRPRRSNALRRSARAADPVAEVKPAQPKPLRLKVNPYEGKEGENLHGSER
ncbi:Gag protein [Phytophthora palmivora]|uniref:Gag protein n=1 Tax=Phytophthora palmivora TaxID=4796 RepID=A0A2P4Y183_9STRA|nr:Gag protein [Phytophthora palmivora]